MSAAADPFAKLPHALLDDLAAGELSASDVLAYAVLMRHADASGLCWPSHDAIAAGMGAGSYRTSIRATARLRRRGWLRVTRQPEGSDGRHRSNTYTVLCARDHVTPESHGHVTPESPNHVTPESHELEPIELEPCEQELELGASGQTDPQTDPQTEQPEWWATEVECLEPECTSTVTRRPDGTLNPLCKAHWKLAENKTLLAERIRTGHYERRHCPGCGGLITKGEELAWRKCAKCNSRAADQARAAVAAQFPDPDPEPP